MEPLKIHNGGNYAYAQDSNHYNFYLSKVKISTKLIGTFIRQQLKGNNVDP